MLPTHFQYHFFTNLFSPASSFFPFPAMWFSQLPVISHFFLSQHVSGLTLERGNEREEAEQWGPGARRCSVLLPPFQHFPLSTSGFVSVLSEIILESCAWGRPTFLLSLPHFWFLSNCTTRPGSGVFSSAARRCMLHRSHGVRWQSGAFLNRNVRQSPSTEPGKEHGGSAVAPQQHFPALAPRQPCVCFTS